MKDDSSAYAALTVGSSASQMTAAKKVMDVVARPPGWAGQAADAASAYAFGKLEKCSKVRMSRRKDTSSTTQMAEILGKH